MPKYPETHQEAKNHKYNYWKGRTDVAMGEVNYLCVNPQYRSSTVIKLAKKNKGKEKKKREDQGQIFCCSHLD